MIKFAVLLTSIFSLFIPTIALGAFSFTQAQKDEITLFGGFGQWYGCLAPNSTVRYIPSKGGSVDYTTGDYATLYWYTASEKSYFAFVYFPGERGARSIELYAYRGGYPLTNEEFEVLMPTIKGFSKGITCEASEECTQGNLTNPGDMLCEENYHGGNLLLNGKRREY